MDVKNCGAEREIRNEGLLRVCAEASSTPKTWRPALTGVTSRWALGFVMLGEREFLSFFRVLQYVTQGSCDRLPFDQLPVWYTPNCPVTVLALRF